MKSEYRFCACGRRWNTQCVSCGTYICTGHTGMAPMADFADVTNLVLRPVCAPACGAPMSRDWWQDVLDWQAQHGKSKGART